MDISRVRQWQVQFEVHRAFETLPVPGVVVEEIQTAPSYRMDGRLRRDGGGQFVITLKGCGGIRIDGVDHELPPGRAFLHVHRDPAVCYYYPRDGKEPWNFLWISFTGDASGRIIAESNRRYGYLFDVPLDSPLVMTLMAYKNCRNEVLFLSPLEGAALSLDLLRLLCSEAEGERRRTPHSALVGEVQTWLTRHPTREHQVARIADEFRISREHLSRIFHTETGITLHEYITRNRLRIAMNLLLHTGLSGKEIADACGWNEYTILYRLCRKRFNLSPGEIRATHVRPDI